MVTRCLPSLSESPSSSWASGCCTSTDVVNYLLATWLIAYAKLEALKYRQSTLSFIFRNNTHTDFGIFDRMYATTSRVRVSVVLQSHH